MTKKKNKPKPFQGSPVGGFKCVHCGSSASPCACVTRRFTDGEKVIHVSAPAGFVKHDENKVRLELIPTEATLALGRAFTYGAKKYAPDNWRKCSDPDRYLGATLRHLVAHQGGELTDKESGLAHLDHAIASLAMLIGLTERLAFAQAGLDGRLAKKSTVGVAPVSYRQINVKDWIDDETYKTLYYKPPATRSKK